MALLKDINTFLLHMPTYYLARLLIILANAQAHPFGICTLHIFIALNS